MDRVQEPPAVDLPALEPPVPELTLLLQELVRQLLYTSPPAVVYTPSLAA